MEARNLYDDSLLIRYTEGDVSLEPIEKESLDTINDVSHIVVEGESLQTIADLHYDDSRKWFYIARKNKLDDVFTLTIGTELIIPDLNRL
jgi:nucleoid-associated protein YgaU